MFLQVETAAEPGAGAAESKPPGPPALVCVLPFNAPPEQAFDINPPGLPVRTNQLVTFRACSSTRHDRCSAGDTLPWDSAAFHMLPPLETMIAAANGPDPGREKNLPVRLSAKTNALGLLQVSCVSTDPLNPGAWPLEFNLRPQEQERTSVIGASASAPVEPNATPEAEQAARDRLSRIFKGLGAKSNRFTANGILKDLERLLATPRHAWNVALLRGLWPALYDRMGSRHISIEHEEAWITLAGFVLRPGFGFAGDALRIDELWRLRGAGLCFPGKRSKVQASILWRRVAGGLTAEWQQKLLADEMESIRAGRASPEVVRLAGSLERLPRGTKTDLIQLFIAQVLHRVELKQHCAPQLTALGLLLNRVPFYGGPESVVPPRFVERAYTAFADFDWTEAELSELPTLFLRAGRVVDDRNLDVPKSVRKEIARKLEAAGVAPMRTAPMIAFAPVGGTDRAALYGDALPPGLVLGADVGAG